MYCMNYVNEDGMYHNNKDKSTPLQIIESAIHNGSSDALNSFANRFGRTPLCLACQAMQVEYIKLLLENDKVDPDKCDIINTPPIVYVLRSMYTIPNACRYSYENICTAQMICKDDEQEIDQNQDQATTVTTISAPINYVSDWRPSVMPINVMMYMGPISDKLNHHKYETYGYEMSVPQHNCTPQHKEILRLFLDHDRTNVNIAFVEVCRTIKTDVDIIKMFMENKSFDVNYIYINSTHLMNACALGNEIIIRLLLDEPNINVNYQNQQGLTAFHMLCGVIHENTNNIKLLLDNDLVDVNLPDNFGNTPYVSCLYNYVHSNEYSKKLYLETLKLLSASDRIDKNKLVHDNMTPLEFVFSDLKNTLKEVLPIYDRDEIINALV